MQFNQTIKRIFSGIFIVLFAFSITPVTILHSLFASHKDKINYTISSSTELTTTGFHCNIDHFVAEGNFLVTEIDLCTQPGKDYPEFVEIPVYPFFSQHHFYSELRGPPAVA